MSPDALTPLEVREEAAVAAPGPVRRRVARIAAALLGVAVALYLGWAALLTVMQERAIFPGAWLPRQTTAGPTDALVQQVWITADDGSRVEGWFQLGAGRSPMSPGPAVIFFHGNAELIERRWPRMADYVRAGVSVLAVEYRGYGRSEGEPSEEALIADAVAFHDWLAARPEVVADKIVHHGFSIGGAVAAALAEQRPPAALIVESTFTSLKDVAHIYGLPGFLCRHPFATDAVLARLDVPTAIFHGRQDEIIPFEHGQRLHTVARNARFTALDTGHDRFENDWSNIAAFLRDVGVLTPNGR